MVLNQKVWVTAGRYTGIGKRHAVCQSTQRRLCSALQSNGCRFFLRLHRCCLFSYAAFFRGPIFQLPNFPSPFFFSWLFSVAVFLFTVNQSYMYGTMMKSISSGWVGHVHSVRILAIRTASRLYSIGLRKFVPRLSLIILTCQNSLGAV